MAGEIKKNIGTRYEQADGPVTMSYPVGDLGGGCPPLYCGETLIVYVGNH